MDSLHQLEMKTSISCAEEFFLYLVLQKPKSEYNIILCKFSQKYSCRNSIFLVDFIHLKSMCTGVSAILHTSVCRGRCGASWAEAGTVWVSIDDMIEFCCRSTLAERPKNVWLYGRFLLAASHFFNAFGLILNVRRHSMARKQAMRLAESDGLGRCACLLAWSSRLQAWPQTAEGHSYFKAF